MRGAFFYIYDSAYCDLPHAPAYACLLYSRLGIHGRSAKLFASSSTSSSLSPYIHHCIVAPPYSALFSCSCIGLCVSVCVCVCVSERVCVLFQGSDEQIFFVSRSSAFERYYSRHTYSAPGRLRGSFSYIYDSSHCDVPHAPAYTCLIRVSVNMGLCKALRIRICVEFPESLHSLLHRGSPALCLFSCSCSGLCTDA